MYRNYVIMYFILETENSVENASVNSPEKNGSSLEVIIQCF